ncbi:MAG: hypothetical protein JSU70_14325, partial [Phycisphaerales bacterium]
EIHPIGWNIANGGCANRKEISDLMSTIQREFAEELVVIDRAQGYRYYFYEKSTKDKNRDSTLHLLEALDLTPKSGEWKHKPLHPEVIPGPGGLSINAGKPIEEVFLNVNMEDLGIEIDQVVKICGLRKTVTLLDGETENSNSVHTTTPGFINAPVGLFRTDRLMDAQSNGEFIPDILFRSGKLTCGEFESNGRNDGSDDNKTLEERIKSVLNQFAKERLEPLASGSWDAYVKAQDKGRAYNLCPVTRTLLRQYVT